jgi:hypothetical protein
VFYGYGDWSLWLIVFLTAFATGYWEYAKVYRQVGNSYDKTRESQNVVMKFDGGFVTKLLGFDTELPLLSPTMKDGKQVVSRVFVFGISAMFLPVIVGIVLGVVLGP